jgi:geranylgeranyl diphosphate synthase type I
MSLNSSPLNSDPLLADMRAEIEKNLQQSVQTAFDDGVPELRDMLRYHMGWLTGLPTGKRLRPLFVLLVCAAAGGNWRSALPAASSVELIHNFSLIHDDIQDRSELRHNQPTLWTQVGIAQAINAGDAMFTLGLKKIWDLCADFPLDTVKTCSDLLQNTCLALTRGQYLDIDFERRPMVQVEEYLDMVSGKTTSLLAACVRIGATLATDDLEVINGFSEYGRNLGMAFQIVDDYLGIWGDTALTGKSVSTDLLTRKKSYPALLGLREVPAFKSLWEQPTADESTARRMAEILKESGIHDLTIDRADEYTRQAVSSLEQVCQPSSLEIMRGLTRWLLRREA